jgi:phosphate transport system substrate-binding protein
MQLRLHKLAVPFLLPWALVFSSFLATSADQNNGDLAVIVHPNNPTKALSLADLRRIFRGERLNWPNNEPVQLVIRASGAREREVVLRVVFQMTETDYKQFWLGKIFRGEAANEPVAVFSNGFGNQAVASSIGMIFCEDAKDVRGAVKVLKIDGRLPGEPGYPLH